MHALPERLELEIRFPRVEGYRQRVRNRITVDWSSIRKVPLDPLNIPPEVQTKGLSLSVTGRLSTSGPGIGKEIKIEKYLAGRRLQELALDAARDLTGAWIHSTDGSLPAQVVFPQMLDIVQRYVAEKIEVIPPATRLELFVAPYYAYMLEILHEAIRPAAAEGEEPEVPILERFRPTGSTADVSFWTSRDVREVEKSHVNYVVADTRQWEQSAAFQIDRHPAVRAFVKNAGLGFAIPYVHNGEPHDFIADFLIRLDTDDERYLILEPKGHDPLAEVKNAAAIRWVAAVNTLGNFGHWDFRIARDMGAVRGALDEFAPRAV